MDLNNRSSGSCCIWSDQEALLKQHEQKARSACGTSAVINVLTALNYEITDYELVAQQIKVNTRIPESDAGCTTLLEYLKSRSGAGMNAAELIANLERVTDGKVTGRFFPFYPANKNFDMINWLKNWIKKGAVPSALLNLQKTPNNGIIPDAWHHQMIYGCSDSEVYLTNPVEHKPLDEMLNELTSESTILVRCVDAVKRFKANERENSFELENFYGFDGDQRWIKLGVEEQIRAMLDKYEGVRSGLDFSTMPTHVSIPASYIPGITLFQYRDSSLFGEILEANDIQQI